jgi:tetratricopeptide (TPR) repeat protein
MWHLWRFTREDTAEARRYFEASLKRDPEFAPSLAALSYLLVLEVILGFAPAIAPVIVEAVSYGERAAEADPRNPFARFALGRALALQGQHGAAVSELRSAVELNPSSAHGHFGLASALLTKPAPEPEEALMHLERTIRLSPHDPNSWGFMTHAAIACLLLGRFAAALEWADGAIRRNPKQFWSHLWKAAALAQLGEQTAASREIVLAEEIRADVSITLLFQTLLRWDSKDNPAIEGLIKAGLAR